MSARTVGHFLARGLRGSVWVAADGDALTGTHFALAVGIDMQVQDRKSH